MYKKIRTSINSSICLLVLFSMVSCTTKTSQKTDDNSKNRVMNDLQLNHSAKVEYDIINAPEEFQEGVISFDENGKFGFKDEAGEIVIPAKYDAVGVFSEGLARVTINGKDGYINHSGELVIPAIYDFTMYFSQGLAVACKGGKYGYIYPSGEVAIPFEYENAKDFFEPNGFAAVRKNGKEGLIDREGKIVMPIQYESAYSTSNGVATIFDRRCEISVFNDGSYNIVRY